MPEPESYKSVLVPESRIDDVAALVADLERDATGDATGDGDDADDAEGGAK